MELVIMPDKRQMCKAAAGAGAALLRRALAERGTAAIIVATGASQFEMLGRLVEEPDIAWNRVTAFHLDEYVGLAITHPASFRRYLWERFVSRLPLPLAAFLDRIGKTPISINFATLAGQGSIRQQVVGLANRRATVEELERMKALAEQAMKDGAFGMSTGLFYVPGS